MRLDLRGKTFGRLTAIEPTRDSQDRYSWHCRCVCGGEKIVLAGHLGRSINSCGCLKKETSAAIARRTAKRKTHCPLGHPYSSENTYMSPRNVQGCRICRYASMRKKTLEYVGWTQEQYDAAMLSQKGLCAICQQPESKLGKTLSADHDHTTLEPRQLLCGTCNSGLGMFKENLALLQAAQDYLQRHK